MIEIVTPGLYTTVQDLGRFGHRATGVPVSGAMDSEAALLANSLLGNLKDEAVLEIVLVGPTLKFHQNTAIAIAGVPFEVTLNDIVINTNRSISIKKNDVLHLGRAKKGMICYLAVAGGIQTPKVLNSRSFYANITKEATLKKGAMLPIKEDVIITKDERPSVKERNFDSNYLEVYPGPEYSSLTIFEQQGLLEQRFIISSQSNRMAYILESGLTLSAEEIFTAPVQPGTVQLTPSGKILVLMRDAQVTGGYARIFQLTEQCINLLAQKRGGEAVGFKVTCSPS